VNEAYAKMQESMTKGEYVDVHVWQFVPNSFVLHVNDLRQLGLINLEVLTSSETLGFEFFARLRKQSATSTHLDQSGRLALARSFSQVFTSRPPQPLSQPQQVDEAPAAQDSAGANKHYVVHHHGWCPICEKDVTFVSENNWLRDYLLCSGCLSIP